MENLTREILDELEVFAVRDNTEVGDTVTHLLALHGREFITADLDSEIRRELMLFYADFCRKTEPEIEIKVCHCCGKAL